MKLSIEELKAFENNPTNNFLTRGQMMDVVRELIAIRELKGEQVPIAWLNDAHLARGHIEGEAGEEDAGPGMIPVYREKFTAPQKPVLLLPPAYEKSADFTEYHQGWNACRNYMLAEAKEAGGIVSTSDERLMQDMSGIVKGGE